MHLSKLFPISLCLLFSIKIFTGSAYAKEELPDIADYHYQGALKIIPETGYINVKWIINVNKKENSQIRFLIRKTLGNIKVTGDSLISHSINQQEGMESFWAIDVSIANNSKNKSIHISYDGVLLPEPLSNKINSIKKDAVELNVDSFWHPIDASFSKKLTIELDIDIAPNWLGVSSGEFRKTATGLKLTNYHPAIDIPFAISNRFKITERDGYTLYDLRDTDDGVNELVSTVNFCKQYLDDNYGNKEKLPAAKFLITDRPSSGYARNSYIAFTDISVTKPTPLTKFVCHELAHFWSNAGKFDTVENWLNEAFAEYAGTMAVRKRFGAETFNKLIQSYRKQISNEQLTAIWQQGDIQRKSYLVQYRKGPLALEKLEKLIGNKQFDRFITQYMENRIATTPDLLKALEAIAGVKAKNHFVKILSE